MTARQWTREALDAAHPEVKAAGWEWVRRPNDSWCARRWADGIRCDVWVSAGSLYAECAAPMAEPHDIAPPNDIALAAILASRGMDSLGAMAGALEGRAANADFDAAASLADEETSSNYDGEADGLRFAADMLRRGRVSP
jgi:hypothetical protein